MTPGEATPDHAHSFLTYPGRCVYCGLSDEAVRQADQARMLAEAFNRLAAVLEKVEAKL